MAHHRLTRPVVVHEFGHSFAGLADEYAYEAEQIPMYPHDIEPWEENITTLVDFKSKWNDLIKKNTLIPTPTTPANKIRLEYMKVQAILLKECIGLCRIAE